MRTWICNSWIQQSWPFLRCNVDEKSHDDSCLFMVTGSSDESQSVVWEIPCGITKQSGVVSIITFVSAVVAAFLIVLTSIYYPHNQKSQWSETIYTNTHFYRNSHVPEPEPELVLELCCLSNWCISPLLCLDFSFSYSDIMAAWEIWGSIWQDDLTFFLTHPAGWVYICAIDTFNNTHLKFFPSMLIAVRMFCF